MAFYEPEIFNGTEEIVAAKQTRFLQPLYDKIIIGREDFLRSPLFIPFAPLVLYHSLCFTWTMIDLLGLRGYLPFFRKRQVQESRLVSWRMIKNILVNYFWNHFLFLLPIGFGQAIWVPPTPLPPVAPKMADFIFQQITFIILFDAFYWGVHVILHKYRFLYKTIHSIHHQYHAPFSLVSNYLHPLEMMVVSLAVSMIPWIFHTHIFTYWIWIAISVYISVEVHTGYDMPWGLHRFIPYWGGVPSHDMHHLRPLTNFQPWLSWLDAIFGWKMWTEDLDKLKSKDKIKSQTYGLYSAEDENVREKFN